MSVQQALANQLIASRILQLNVEQYFARFEITDRPQATFHEGGVGYWTTRSRAPNGYILQGIGETMPESWDEWKKLSGL